MRLEPGVRTSSILTGTRTVFIPAPWRRSTSSRVNHVDLETMSRNAMQEHNKCHRTSVSRICRLRRLEKRRREHCTNQCLSVTGEGGEAHNSEAIHFEQSLHIWPPMLTHSSGGCVAEHFRIRIQREKGRNHWGASMVPAIA